MTRTPPTDWPDSGNRFDRGGSSPARRARSRPGRRAARPDLETLETRRLLSTILPPTDIPPAVLPLLKQLELDDSGDTLSGTLILPTVANATPEVETLPDRDVSRVQGTIPSADVQRMFMLPLGNDTVAVDLELRPASGSGPILEEFEVLDARGNALIRMTPAPGATSLRLKLPTPRTAGNAASREPLFLRVAMPATPPGGSIGDLLNKDPASNPAAQTGTGPWDFVLVVLRESGPAAPTDAPTMPDLPAATTSPGGNASSPVPQTTSASGGLPTAPVWPTLPATVALRVLPPTRPIPDFNSPLTSGGDSTGPLISTGPLPSRAAAPAGGALAHGEAAPVANGRDPAAVDLSLMELPPAGRADAEPSGAETGETTAAPTDEAVVTVRGPGGVPLLGASLLTETRAGNPEWPSLAAFAADRLADEGDTSAASADARAALAGGSQGVDESLPGRTNVRRTSILAVVSMACVLSLRLSLPERLDAEAERPTRRSFLRRFLARRGPATA